MAQENISTVVFGCGNVVMGDDGYGPAVVDALNSRYQLPAGVEAIDAGTGIREYLFDYILTAEGRPDRIIVLDAVDFPDREPGDVFLMDTSAIPPKKIHDFSLHQFPTVNLLVELEQHTGVRVVILAAQVETIPDEITPGLSPAMSAAVSVACEKVLHILSE
ncbi:hydrogenase maturation protease [Desulfoprunum benzoelyticum]|uniref:Coenzyme F420 hydrogenase subunit delta n=1 Tax=Desulfoprunum benzoelyticum TaxID=1506996 RepID=A0A840V2E7_9BACT|nr:hydrogenase maturation protease [Desulfoprunum benzoelyticum]MBB5347321.1 coenzyme F420 hydrogenase subunit delta [Desulfoprunum benzoelyticum]MBM9530736.1 hydrogenase maturation protease [Desulfoprunum benzoelyticum]